MAEDAEIRAWAKARGVKVSDRGAVSARLRAEYELARGATSSPRLPNPSDIAEDAGIIDIGEPPAPPGQSADSGPAGGRHPADNPVSAGPEPDDEPPPHARREWRQKPRSRGKTTSAPPRMTAGLRNDIEGKIGFGLEIPGRIWQARDPLCGGVFVQQVPEITRSLTNWVIRSPQLVEWFTSPAGSGFMLLLDTAAAVGPVMSVVMAHHVYHTVELGAEDEEQPDQAQYAA